jgi:peroxiredoxin
MPTLFSPNLSLRLTAFYCLAYVCGVTAAQAQAPHPADERGYIVRVGDPVPNFELTSTEGKTFTRENLLGQAYVLQFTASWCGVCRQEMPHLEREVWQPNKGANFTLIGVDLDEPAEKVAAFAQKMGITYPMAPDPEGTLFYQIAGPKSGVTRNVVVDANGDIVFLTRLFKAEEFEAMKSAIARVIP